MEKAAAPGEKPVGPRNELATRIYVELVARNTEIIDGAVKMKAGAPQLAALSLKLAEAFVEAEQAAIAAKAPVSSYKLDAGDIASWMK